MHVTTANDFSSLSPPTQLKYVSYICALNDISSINFNIGAPIPVFSSGFIVDRIGAPFYSKPAAKNDFLHLQNKDEKMCYFFNVEYLPRFIHI